MTAGGMPTNPWVPGAIVSFFFPGLGLLFLPNPQLKSLGIKVFVGYVIVMIGLPITIAVVAGLTGIYALGYLGSLLHLFRLVIHPAAMLHTHDATVKMNPALGKPILFKN